MAFIIGVLLLLFALLMLFKGNVSGWVWILFFLMGLLLMYLYFPRCEALNVNPAVLLEEDKMLDTISDANDSIPLAASKNTVSVKPVPKKTKKAKTYNIKAIELGETRVLPWMIVEKLSDLTELNHTREKADYHIKIKYTGARRPNIYHGTLYSYSGGHLEVIVNDKVCCCTEGFKLKASSRTGNALHVERENLKGKVNALLENEIETIAQIVKRCL